MPSDSVNPPDTMQKLVKFAYEEGYRMAKVVNRKDYHWSFWGNSEAKQLMKAHLNGEPLCLDTISLEEGS